MLRTFLFCALAAAAGCSFGDDRPLTGDGGPDGQPDGMDGPPMMDKDHLLISEIKSTEGNEFIEIWNPTNRNINLGNYYLSDYGDYWKFPSGTLTSQQSDFVVGFPVTAVINSKQVITVATKSAMFNTSYGPATYALDIATDDGTTKAFRFRLTEASQLPAITDTGEPIVLFYWDGTSDLVKDVDIVFAGLISGSGATNRLALKAPVDGPDVDTTSTAYKAESGMLGGGTMTTVGGGAVLSYKRRKFETGAEAQNGNGNGITGDDETSENLTTTWDGVPGTAPFTAPTPGVAPTI